jgi:two-component SAPR family response regulator
MLRTILIDDELPALHWLQSLLQSYSDVEIAGLFTYAEEALAFLGSERVDVAFLDIEMPGMNGKEAAERLLDIHPGLDIVFVTAHNLYASEIFELNAIDYVLKPATARRLSKTIERIAARRKDWRSAGQAAATASKPGFVCLGRFQWLADTRAPETADSIKWRTTKERELAAYLVHHRGQWVSMDSILEALLADKEVEQAKTFLHTCIYNIRKNLSRLGCRDMLTYRDNHYRLDLTGLDCDAVEFEQIAGKESDFATDGLPTEALERAVGLYRGDYMEEDGFLWALKEQERFKSMYLRLLQHMAKRYLEKGEAHAAVVCLERALFKNPFLDEANELMLLALARIGDRLALVRHYEQYVKQLKEELDMSPRSSTVDLFRQLSVGGAG